MAVVRIALVGLLLPLLAIGMGSQDPKELIGPPIHRTWTVLTNELTQLHGLRDNVIFYTSQNAVGAIDIRSGSELWKKPVGGICHAATMADDRLLVLNNEVREGEGHLTRLSSYSLADGERKELGKFEGFASSVIADSSKAYVLLPDCTLLAINLKDNSHAWKSMFYETTKPTDYANKLTIAHGRLFVGMPEAGAFCLDPATGKLLWSHHPEFGTDKLIISTKKGVVTTYDGVSLRDVKTGKAIWTFAAKQFDPHALCGQVLIGWNGSSWVGINVESGEQLWSIVTKDEISRDEGIQLLPSTDNSTILQGEKLLQVDRKGRVGWTMESPFSGRIRFAGPDYLIVHDDVRIICYRQGAQSAINLGSEDKRSQILKMVKDFALLDDVERHQLRQFPEIATQPLITEYVRLSVESIRTESDDGFNYHLSILKESALELLQEMCTRADTEALEAAIASLDNGPDTVGLVRIIGSRGDVERTIPNFITSLENGVGDEGVMSEMLAAVAESSRPDAVRFMIQTLKNPEAPTEWRSMAFVHLAGTGGEAGAAAVLEARNKKGPRARWDSGFTDSLTSENVLRKATDSKGREWRLVEHYVLGNFSDLYLQAKKGDGYGKPLFLNLFTAQEWSGGAPSEFRGIPLKTFLDGQWAKILPDDKIIRQDSDADGLTDLVEARLGTNPKSTNTDADQLSDAIDPCPNAAPRKLNDREKIISACIDARFFGYGKGAPAILRVDGVLPFELYGYEGTVMWWGDNYRGSLTKMYGGGVNTISFHIPWEESDSNKKKDWVKISSDGRTAETAISRYSGGLNGDVHELTLKKIGDDWFVVKMKLTIVS